jgi:hypothetical protein
MYAGLLQVRPGVRGTGGASAGQGLQELTLRPVPRDAAPVHHQLQRECPW